MNTNATVYPRWEREGRVSRFLLGPTFSFYEVEEIELTGGPLFVASALDTSDMVGQFESERNARQACARDFAQRQKAGESHGKVEAT
ncbi:MAG TPA: hypothetical protein VGD78_06540 [Chthoniobacterales bacterium]